MYWVFPLTRTRKNGKKYDINGIPALFLLDGNGKIIATGLRGDDMRKKVAEYCK